MTPIRELDGRVIGAGKAGPVTKAIQKAFFDVVTGKDKKRHKWLTPRQVMADPRKVDVTEKDLPLHCPLPARRSGRAPARVPADVAHEGEALCPYCGTKYVYTGAPVKGPLGTRLPRILVVAPNWIGDALMAQPLLARLHEQAARRAASTCSRPPWVAPVARRMPEVAEVIEAPFAPRRAAAARAAGASGAASGRAATTRRSCCPTRWKSALVPFFADIPLRSGYVGESRYGLLNLLYRTPPGKAARMRLHYARLAEAPGAQPTQPLPSPRLRVAADEIAARRGEIRPVDSRYVALCPAPSTGRPSAGPTSPRWPAKLGAAGGAARLGERR